MKRQSAPPSSRTIESTKYILALVLGATVLSMLTIQLVVSMLVLVVVLMP